MTAPSDAPKKSSAATACPICQRPATAEYRPFCSRRCGDVDLQRWLSGRYAIPVVEPDEPDDFADDA